MEKLYVNGSIHTLDAASPLVSALAAVDGRIVAIGTEPQFRLQQRWLTLADVP